MPTIVIPPPYRGATQGLERIAVAGRTVRDCIDAVSALHPAFGPLVLDKNGGLHRFVKLFRNGDQLSGDALASSGTARCAAHHLATIAGG